MNSNFIHTIGSNDAQILISDEETRNFLHVRLQHYFGQQSVSGTSGGRQITNTRGPLSDVIEVAATIIHNLCFTKHATQIVELVAWHASCLWFSGSNPDRADNFFKRVVNVS